MMLEGGLSLLVVVVVTRSVTNTIRKDSLDDGSAQNEKENLLITSLESSEVRRMVLG